MIPHRREGEGPGSSQIDPTTGLVVATCYWDDCDNAAPILHGFLVFTPTGLEEIHIPLCTTHLNEALARGARGAIPRSVIRRIEG